MFLLEPIVLCCSLLAGFGCALGFTFIQSFTLVYKQWGFEAPKTALTFIPLLIGYIVAWASYAIPIERQKRMRCKTPDKVTPESRLWWVLYGECNFFLVY